MVTNILAVRQSTYHTARCLLLRWAMLPRLFSINCVLIQHALRAHYDEQFMGGKPLRYFPPIIESLIYYTQQLISFMSLEKLQYFADSKYYMRTRRLLFEYPVTLFRWYSCVLVIKVIIIFTISNE